MLVNLPNFDYMLHYNSDAHRFKLIKTNKVQLG